MDCNSTLAGLQSSFMVKFLSFMKFTVSSILSMILGFSLFVLLLISPLMVRLSIYQRVKPNIFSIDDVPYQKIAIVFGAGLNRNGQPTTVLRDRVEIASELYKKGKVVKLLFSGDNHSDNYNEPMAMQDYALSLGIPKDAIVLDYAGRRTYDTCYRAKHIFGIENAILVTQSFHLPRALYTCQELGIHSIGVPSDIHSYRTPSLWYWNLRETIATMNAVFDLKVTHPTPVLGEPEPIFPKETQ